LYVKAPNKVAPSRPSRSAARRVAPTPSKHTPGKPTIIAIRSHRSSTSRQMATAIDRLLIHPAVASLDQVDRLADAVL
jgi:hypothetical protein